MADLRSNERRSPGFHKLEADFFHRLVHDLGQDPTNTRWVIAFWLWLESVGHHNFIRRAYVLPGPVVLRLVEEAGACLSCLAGERQDDRNSRVASLSCTNALLAEPVDDVGYFFEHRKTIMKGVNHMYMTVCLVACVGNTATDVPAGNTGGARAAPPPTISTPAGPVATLTMRSPDLCAPRMMRLPDRTAPLMMNSADHGAPLMMGSTGPVAPLMMSSFRHGAPLMTSSPDHRAKLMMSSPGPSVQLMMSSFYHGAPLMMSAPGSSVPLTTRTPWCAAVPMLNPTASPWVPMQGQSALPEDHRSLFVTFSKGYPVSREDIHDFFNSMFGPCVEAVLLEKVQPGEVPLYARVVLHSAAMIPLVLQGQQTAKFMIRGKHVWARVYVPSSS